MVSQSNLLPKQTCVLWMSFFIFSDITFPQVFSRGRSWGHYPFDLYKWRGIRIFADGCILYNLVSSRQDQDTLNYAFKHFVSWSKKWQMEISFIKTVNMSFVGKHSSLLYSYGAEGHTLLEVQEFRYLGPFFTSDLKWSQHIKSIRVKALKKIAYIKENWCSPALLQNLWQAKH